MGGRHELSSAGRLGFSAIPMEAYMPDAMLAHRKYVEMVRAQVSRFTIGLNRADLDAIEDKLNA